MDIKNRYLETLDGLVTGIKTGEIELIDVKECEHLNQRYSSYMCYRCLKSFDEGMVAIEEGKKSTSYYPLDYECVDEMLKGNIFRQ